MKLLPFAQTREAPVIVWDATTHRQIYNLFGIREGIKHLAFAPDDRFLVAAGMDDMLYMWDMQTGEQLYARSFKQSIGFLSWGPVTIPHRRPEYRLYFSLKSTVYAADVTYDVKVLRYGLSAQPVGMPCTGYNRSYLCGAYDMHSSHPSVLAGTESGELAVFSAGSNLYRGSFPIGSNGVHAVCVVPVRADSATGMGSLGAPQSAVHAAADSTIRASVAGAGGAAAVYCGTGDGALVRVAGSDLSWKVIARVDLVGMIVSITAVPGGDWLLVGTAAGRVYRVAVSEKAGKVHLSPYELESAHTGPVTCVAFGRLSDVFATGSADGRVRVWDLNDYSVLQSSRGPVGATVNAVAMDDDFDGSIVSAWSDGALRSFAGGTGDLAWHLPAHRGSANTVALTPVAIVSGGDDGRVAVWSRGGREQVAVFQDHTKPVLQVIADFANSALLHSVGADRCIFSFDLKTERRVTCHQLPSAAAAGMVCISQRLDSEQEVVSAAADGRVLCWDIDIPDTPVQELPAPNAAKINAIAVSPSGRFVATAGDDAALTLYELMPLSTHLATQGVTPVGGEIISRKALEGHTGRVLGLAWAPDEKQLVSVGDDSCIVVHNFYGAAEQVAMDAGGIEEPTSRGGHAQQAHSQRPGGVPLLTLG